MIPYVLGQPCCSVFVSRIKRMMGGSGCQLEESCVHLSQSEQSFLGHILWEYFSLNCCKCFPKSTTYWSGCHLEEACVRLSQSGLSFLGDQQIISCEQGRIDSVYCLTLLMMRECQLEEACVRLSQSGLSFLGHRNFSANETRGAQAAGAQSWETLVGTT